MPTIYQADLWCDDCGRALVAALIKANQFPKYWTPNDRRRVLDRWNHYIDTPGVDYDSDDWPSVGHPAEPTDSPSHCAAGADCCSAIDLTDYGLPPSAPCEGAETHRIGALLGDSLTPTGQRYVADLLAEPDDSLTPYQRALRALWDDTFWLGGPDD